jgi:DNA-binding SARP family transcriptional activator
MGTLRISLFGHVQVSHDDGLTEIRLPHILQALLAYLLLTPHRVYPREVLMELFWTEASPQQARGCLNTALWRLRQALEPDQVSKGTYLLTTANGQVGFNWESEYWLDVLAFQETVQRLIQKPVEAMSPAEVDELLAKLELCQGDLMEGFYDDWMLRERERYRQLYLDGLQHLMLINKSQGDYKQSLIFGQRILEYDPLRESIHRELMDIYRQAGEPGKAIRQYQICREILARELNIPPMPETQSLYSRILASSRRQTGPAPAVPLPEFQQGLVQLQLALAECRSAQAKLQQVVSRVQQLLDQYDEDAATQP